MLAFSCVYVPKVTCSFRGLSPRRQILLFLNWTALLSGLWWRWVAVLPVSRILEWYHYYQCRISSVNIFEITSYPGQKTTPRLCERSSRWAKDLQQNPVAMCTKILLFHERNDLMFRLSGEKLCMVLFFVFWWSPTGLFFLKSSSRKSKKIWIHFYV